MKLTLQLKLQTDKQQNAQLLETMEAFNDACNYIAQKAFELKTASQLVLHKLTYYEIRQHFGLSAQMAIRAIGKVAEAQKQHKKKSLQFKPHGAIVYDSRILKFKFPDRINIKTLKHRIEIPFVFCNYRQIDIRRVRGQADLVYRDGQFYLYICIDIPEPPEEKPSEFLGIDMGIVNIATDSDGESFAGNHVNSLRKRHAKLRKRLQSKKTKSARRLLSRRKRKESWFARNVNHVISRKIVEKAKRTGRGIAIEDLNGIRNRIRVKKSQRRQQHSWGFHNLRKKLEYKAKLAGIPVILIDPHYTSQMCSQCGYVSRANRPSQATFSCKSCGFSAYADYNAALNIRSRAIVNLPDAVSVEARAPKQLMLFAVNCGRA